MEGDEEAVEEVQQMIFMLDNFPPIEKVAGKQPQLFLWPKDLLKPELQINLIVNEQVVCSGVANMNLFEQIVRHSSHRHSSHQTFITPDIHCQRAGSLLWCRQYDLFEQARRERVEERKRQRRDREWNDWDERMAKEEMLARRITRLLQKVDVPQVDS